jgi:CBS domain-containing protein
MFSLELVMTANPVTISPSTPLSEASRLMQEHRFRHLPVVNAKGELVGLLTQTDVLSATDSIFREADNQMPVTNFPVEDIMVTDVKTVTEDTSVRQAAMFIEKHRIGCLPVMSGTKLVGIITDTDFVGVAINLLEQLEEFEPPEED